MSVSKTISFHNCSVSGNGNSILQILKPKILEQPLIPLFLSHPTSGSSAKFLSPLPIYIQNWTISDYITVSILAQAITYFAWILPQTLNWFHASDLFPTSESLNFSTVDILGQITLHCRKCHVHCKMFRSITGFYTLNANSTHSTNTSLPRGILTNKYISRYCQMPEQQNHPLIENNCPTVYSFWLQE